MIKAQTYTYEGKSLTIKEWSELLGVHFSTVYQRLQNGLPYSKVFTARKHSDAPQYFAQGKMLTLKEWSKILGVSVNGLQTRLSKGLPHCEVFTPKDHAKARVGRPTKPEPELEPLPMNIPFYSGKNANRITYQGKEQTVKEWASELGLDRTVTLNRFNAGRSARQVLNLK